MNPPHIYFAGTGSLLMSSLGVAKYLREHYDVQDLTVLSVSGGGIAAVALLTLEVEQFDEKAHQIATILDGSVIAAFANNPKNAKAMKKVKLGPMYRKALEVLVTEDTLPALRNHLQIATTTIPFLDRKTYTGPYRTADEVMLDLQASAYIPKYFNRSPYRHHLFEIDGGASQSPIDLSTALTVTVGYTPESDVYLSTEDLDSRRFYTYDEHMDLYEDGYWMASELRDQIDEKLLSNVS